MSETQYKIENGKRVPLTEADFAFLETVKSMPPVAPPVADLPPQPKERAT